MGGVCPIGLVRGVLLLVGCVPAAGLRALGCFAFTTVFGGLVLDLFSCWTKVSILPWRNQTRGEQGCMALRTRDLAYGPGRFGFCGAANFICVVGGLYNSLGFLRSTPAEEGFLMSDTGKRWYVVHTYSGFEKMVLRALGERIAQSSFADSFGQIVLPTEEVMDVKNGKKSISERKFFPGYLFIEMEMSEQTWHLVKSTPQVTGFIGGSGNKPRPLSSKEMDAVLLRMESSVEKPKPKVMFEVGQSVRVTEGPFVDFNGSVEEISYERSKLRVAVQIFGRETPVELDFDQVEKV